MKLAALNSVLHSTLGRIMAGTAVVAVLAGALVCSLNVSSANRGAAVHAAAQLADGTESNGGKGKGTA